MPSLTHRLLELLLPTGAASTSFHAHRSHPRARRFMRALRRGYNIGIRIVDVRRLPGSYGSRSKSWLQNVFRNRGGHALGQ
jgi:hypothetical protein